jgi:hypothetical protein
VQQSVKTFLNENNMSKQGKASLSLKANKNTVKMVVFWAFSGICLLVVLMIWFRSDPYRMQSPVVVPSAKKGETPSLVAVKTPPEKLSNTVFSYEKDGLILVSANWEKDGNAVWRVTIRNVSDKPLGEIKYQTFYGGADGTTVRRGGVDGLGGKDTIQKVVPPNSTVTIEVDDGFVDEKAVAAGFNIVSWRVAE